MFMNESCNFLDRGTRPEDGLETRRLQQRDIFGWNHSPADKQYVGHSRFFQQFCDTGKVVFVRARKTTECDDIRVLFDGSLHNQFCGRSNAEINDLHAGIPKSQREYVRSTIVAIQSRFRQHRFDWSLSRHKFAPAQGHQRYSP